MRSSSSTGRAAKAPCTKRTKSTGQSSTRSPGAFCPKQRMPRSASTIRTSARGMPCRRSARSRSLHFWRASAATSRAIKLDKLRAKKRSAEVSALTEELSACIADPTAAREAESREIAEALNSFLSTLPVDARLFFMRRYWYMDSVKAIAEKYGCGESRVKTSLHRTREKLRNYLQKADIWL